MISTPVATPTDAALVLAAAPGALGGAWLRGPPGPVRDAWIDLLREVADRPTRRVPASATTEGLVGGMDLPATLAAGRPVGRPGLLRRAHEGLLLLPSAERLESERAALLTSCLDTGELRGQRDGLELGGPARFAVVAMDESRDGEAPPPRALLDRLALVVDLPRRWTPEDDGVGPADVRELRGAVVRAGRRWRGIEVAPEHRRAAVAAALLGGSPSLRLPLHAVRVARILAALDGRDAVDDGDLSRACALSLLPRLAPLPAEAEDEAPPEEPPPPEPGTDDADDDGEGSARDPSRMTDRTVESARAVLPPGLVERLQAAGGRTTASGGRRTREERGPRGRGRVVGSRPGRPGGGRRLHLLATLRAAAPWQTLRRREDPAGTSRLHVRTDDLQVAEIRRPQATGTVFVVDASGSQALNRLAETKGAVEMLLSESYVRREEVVLVTFRGRSAEVALPPTRSLARARRLLAGVPGGGGTPLALGLLEGARQAEALARRGVDPVIVVLTDGRPNVDREGRGGRPRAREDALDAARVIRRSDLRSVVLDTSPRGTAFLEELARAMGGTREALPHPGARAMHDATRRAREAR